MVLDRADSYDPANAETTDSILFLLSVVLPEVPPAILRRQGGRVSKLLAAITQSNKEEQSVVRHAVECMGVILHVAIASPQYWQDEPTAKALYSAVVPLSADSRVKVRKAAHTVIVSLWDQHREFLKSHDGGATGQFFMTLVKSGLKVTGDAMQQVLSGLNLLAEIWGCLKPKAIVSIAAEVFKLWGRQQPMIKLMCLQAMEGLFQKLAGSGTPVKTAKTLVLGASEWQVPATDPQQINAYFKMLSAGFSCLATMDTDTCEANLPTAVKSLCTHLSNENGDISNGAVSQLESIFATCVSESMAEEAHQQAMAGNTATPLAQIVKALNQSMRKLEPHKLQKALPIYKSLLECLQQRSFPLLADVVSALGALAESSQGSMRRSVERIIGTAIAQAGPEGVLEVLPLEIDLREGITAESRTWLLPILKAHVQNSSLMFYGGRLLALGNGLFEGARVSRAEGYEIRGRNMDIVGQQLWELLPSFCKRPTDLPTAFPQMAKVLGAKISSQTPDLCGVVCNSLIMLINQNKMDAASKSNKAAAQNLAALATYARNFMPLLFNTYTEAQDSQALQAVLSRAIEAYSSIAPKDVLNNFFKGVVQKLLAASVDVAEHAMRPVMTELALMLVRDLDEEATQLLFRVVKPQLTDEDATVCKKSYKVLLRLCELHPGFVQGQLGAITEALGQVAGMATPAAKRGRMQVMREIAMQVDDTTLKAYIPTVLAECILTTREANFKAREAAYDFFVSVGHRCASCAEMNLEHFVTMIVAGLGGQSTHMIGATVLTLSRLLYEFKAQLAPIFPSLFQSITTLLDDETHEIARAALGFVKVALSYLPTELLEPYMPTLVVQLLEWSTDSKNEFRLRVKVIFERLMRRVGFEAMEPFFPDEHRKFLVHIRKEMERQKRKKNVVKQHTSHDFEDALEEGEQEGEGDQEDDEDDDEDDEMGDAQHDGGSAMLDDADENLDMMDGGNLQAEVARAAVQVGRKGKRGRDEDEEEEEEEPQEFTVNDEGKIVIEDEKKEDKKEEEEQEEEGQEVPMQARSAKRQRRERDQGRYKQSGAIFKAKKAGGDVKRGAIDPYAYLPLDARLGNKKKKAQASKALKAVVQGSKQGAKMARGRKGHKRR